MKKLIWDFWASRYGRLWVQKKSLGPTREYVVKLIEEEWIKGAKTLLDLGCGPGELIELARRRMDSIQVTGLDFSKGMLLVSEGKNPNTEHILLDAEDLAKLDKKYDMVTCTHSLPYYREKKKIIRDIKGILNPNGKLIVAFASGNNLYDKIVLLFVKLTTGPASYLSDRQFREVVRGAFAIESRHVIKEKVYMPTIVVYTLRRL